MTSLSDVAAVQILLADYAVIDASAKLNIIGGGLSLVGQLPGTPVSSGFALIVSIEVPKSHYGVTVNVRVSLETAAGDTVRLPAVGSSQAQELSITQTQTLAPPELPEAARELAGYLPARIQAVALFPPGLPLAKNGAYQWRVSVDGESRDEWCRRFIVSELQAPPVPKPLAP